jgi:hypothetical protein
MIGTVERPPNCRKEYLVAYELLQCGSRQYAVDWVIVRRMLLSYYVADLQWQSQREVSLSESHWWNPASWSMPDVSHIEVDWPSVHRVAAQWADEDVVKMRNSAKIDARGVAFELESRIDAAGKLKENFLDLMGDVQTRNMHKISEATEDYEGQVELLRFVRDTSADGLMVGASIMSGGAAGFAALRAGSILKGVAKWQDSGSIAAGILEAEGSLVFGCVRLGKKFSFKGDMVIALFQSAYKTGTELVAGSTMKKALISGALKLSSPGMDRFFKGDGAMSFFDKVAVPLSINYGGKQVAADLLARWAGKVVFKQGVEGYGKSVLQGGSPPVPPTPRTTAGHDYQRGLLADATLTNKYLLYLSFVDMERGIGRGW